VHVQSLGSFNNALSLFRADSFSDLASPLPVGHHQTVELVNVVDQEFLEAHVVSAGVPGVFVGSITDAWVASLTAESSSEGTIDTLWSSPATVSNSYEPIDLVSCELLVSLLQERVFVNSLLSHVYLK